MILFAAVLICRLAPCADAGGRLPAMLPAAEDSGAVDGTRIGGADGRRRAETGATAALRLRIPPVQEGTCYSRRGKGV